VFNCLDSRLRGNDVRGTRMTFIVRRDPRSWRFAGMTEVLPTVRRNYGTGNLPTPGCARQILTSLSRWAVQ